MDDDQLKFSEECSDQSTGHWAVCVPGYNPLLTQTGSTYVAYREAPTLTEDSPLNVMVKQWSVVDESVPVLTPNEVDPREETLSYGQESKHKVVIGMMKDFTIIADGDKDGLNFSCLKQSSST